MIARSEEERQLFDSIDAGTAPPPEEGFEHDYQPPPLFVNDEVSANISSAFVSACLLALLGGCISLSICLTLGSGSVLVVATLEGADNSVSSQFVRLSFILVLCLSLYFLCIDCGISTNATDLSGWCSEA